MTEIKYSEAVDIIKSWLDTWDPPKDVREALDIAMLAMKRCEYFDEQAEKKKKS